MKSILKSVCSLLLALFISTPVIAAKTAAEMLPPETAFLINVPNLSQLQQQIQKTSFYMLWKDPAMAAFVSDVDTKWRQEISKLDKNNFIRNFTEFEKWPTGQTALAIVLNSENIKNEPAGVLIAEWGQNIAAIKDVLNKLHEKNIEMGGSRKSEQFQGFDIESLIDEGGSEYYFCFVDTLFAACDSIETLKFVVAHAGGASSQTLASSSDYKDAVAATGPDSDLNIYVNIKGIITTALKSDQQGSVKSLIDNLGFSNVVSLSVSAGVGKDPDAPVNIKGMLKVDGQKQGIIKMLEPDTVPVDVPVFVPSSAYSVTVVNLDYKKAIGELENILNSFSPMMAAWMYSPLPTASQPGERGLLIKDDIVTYLGNQTVLAYTSKKPFSTKASPFEMLIAVSVSNRQALENSLGILHSRFLAPDDPQMKRELLGHNLYLVNAPFMPFAMIPMANLAQSPESYAAMPKTAFTVTDTHLLIGSEESVEKAIRDAVSKDTQRISTQAWFAKAKQLIPSSVGIAAFQNETDSAELFWWMFKQLASNNSGPDDQDQLPIFGSLNFMLLPEFGTVKQYFGISSSYMISKPDGFYFESKTTRN